MTPVPLVLRLFITTIILFLSLPIGNSLRLLCICNGSIATINPIDAKITLLDVYVDAELIITVMADPGKDLYILHGFVDDTNQGIWVYRASTYEKLLAVTMERAVDSVYYDPALSKYYALDFNGIFEVDIKTGKFTPVLPFSPSFEFIDEDSMAYDTQLHRLTFMNSSAMPVDTLSTVDVVHGTIIGNYLLTPAPGQQVSPMTYAPQLPTGFVLGWADHKFSRINTTSGVMTTVMNTIYTPFDTLSTAVDPTGRTLSFVGTDGKEHCFIVTIDIRTVPWTVTCQPLTTPDITYLPSALAYFP